jgi:hypothetical protein
VDEVTDSRLKAYATLSRTINLGRFSSIKIELSEEFYPGDRTHLQVVVELDKRIQEIVKVLRVVQADD